MSILIISDIHGSATALRSVLSAVSIADSDKILLIGDIMYHGPRNPIPEGYDPMAVSEILNEYKDQIVSVRGNCDSEVDQMCLQFPAHADFAQVRLESQDWFLTHGHLMMSDRLGQLNEKTIVVTGHTHIPVLEGRDGLVWFNPGSITLPKGEEPASFGWYEEEILSLRSVKDGEDLVSMVL